MSKRKQKPPAIPDTHRKWMDCLFGQPYPECVARGAYKEGRRCRLQDRLIRLQAGYFSQADVVERRR